MSTGHVPPENARAAARRGLELRKKHGKGGLTTQEAGKQGIGSGVARASNLAAGDAVSTETLRRMLAFFSRHRKNKSGGEDDAGYIAWLLWGGDPGEAWAKRELAKVDSVSKGGPFQPFIDLLTPMLPGWLELPASYAKTLGAALEKGLSHRYIRRVPTGKLTKTGKMRYRYYYHAAHGGTVGNEDHFVVGASFKDDDGHWHITARDGDKITLKHDETGAEQTMTPKALREHLVSLHRGAIEGAKAKVKADLADATAAGASAKQVARLRERAARVGVKEEAPKVEPKTEETPESKSREEKPSKTKTDPSAPQPFTFLGARIPPISASKPGNHEKALKAMGNAFLRELRAQGGDKSMALRTAIDAHGGAVSESKLSAKLSGAESLPSNPKLGLKLFRSVLSNDAFDKYIGTKGRPATIKVSPGRANFNPNDSTITVPPDRIDPIPHELGHWLETNSVAKDGKPVKSPMAHTIISKASSALLKRRTQYKEKIPLNDLVFGGTYHQSEMTVAKSGFFSPYVAKFYEDDVKGTEVVAMGIESLVSSDAKSQILKDPEHLGLILAILTGRIDP